MKVRHIKRRHDIRNTDAMWLKANAFLARMFDAYPNPGDDDEWPDDDFDVGPVCGHCGAGLSPLEDYECWSCGEEQ